MRVPDKAADGKDDLAVGRAKVLAVPFKYLAKSSLIEFNANIMAVFAKGLGAEG